MGEIIDFPDIHYGELDGEIVHVSAGFKNGCVTVDREGAIITSQQKVLLSKEEVKSLFIGWLALEYPEVLKEDK